MEPIEGMQFPTGTICRRNAWMQVFRDGGYSKI